MDVRITKFINRIASDSKTVISQNSVYYKKLTNRLELLLSDERTYPTISNKIENLDNWTGVYAEILMISFFKEYDLTFELERKLLKKDTLLKTNKYVIPDIYLSWPYNLFFEIKRFTGIHKELTSHIINIVQKSFPHVEILANYQYDSFLNNGSKAVSKEIENLKKAVSKGEHSHYSENYLNLHYTIYHNRPKMTMSFHSHNPYRFAKEFRYYVINHANQILKDKPNFLSFVLSPKYDFNFTTNFKDEEAFRALSRRVFMQLINDNTPIYNINPKWNSLNLKIKHIARRINGIAFYVDGIDDKDNIYFFMNPNVNKKNKEKFGIEQLKMSMDYKIVNVDVHFEDFEYDNY